MDNRKIGLLSSNIDYITIFVYIVLAFFGWISIYAAVYNDDGRSIFDLSQRYGMQMVWLAISFTFAIAILLIDSKYYHLLAYHIYWVAVLLMVGVLIFGREVNGAKSWIGIGPVGIQPVEFMKIATALALAKFMSSYNFNISSSGNLVWVALIIFFPILMVLLQNDTGSALVFFSFFIVLYREGFGATIYLVTMYMALVAILGFFLSVELMVVLVLVSMVLFELYTNRRRVLIMAQLKPIVRYLALLVLLSLVIEFIQVLFMDEASLEWSVILAVLITSPLVVGYVLNGRSRSAQWYLVLFVASAMLVLAREYAFDNVLQPHQQERILDLLGIEDDPQGAGYNAMQSKIAIGSGGLYGKGFLQGTQTRFSFVPEQSTDFIFCTIGEEWGFVGSMSVVLLFGFLIYRLFRMGERQKEPFARIYCYSVAGVFLLHFAINIMMTIGIFPVIGIPLPFFSYGGSSLLAFTVMLFIAIRLDSSQWEGTARKLF